jgi:hypothetical protein
MVLWRNGASGFEDEISRYFFDKSLKEETPRLVKYLESAMKQLVT